MICLLLIGIPLLGHGGANIPSSLTAQESLASQGDIGGALEAKQRASAAWREMMVGAGFSFTGLGMGTLLLLYCMGCYRGVLNFST
jgi:hypothetical protein